MTISLYILYLSCCCWWQHYCHNSMLASPRKKIGDPGRKSETLMGLNINTLMCLRYQVWCTPMWDKMLPHITPPWVFCTIFYIQWACDVTSPSTTTQTANKHHHHGDWATPPSSGVDPINPRCLSGGQPCACLFQGRCQRVLVESMNWCRNQ